MENRIETLEPTTILGMNLDMSFANDRTRELWQRFGPVVRKIENRKDGGLISLQRFSRPIDPKNPDPEMPFTKWAAVAIETGDGTQLKELQAEIPDLKTYEVQGGLYAVFRHLGPASDFMKSVRYIYGVWFPGNSYVLDDREHFEILPPGYRPDDPKAEEEIWIPIKKK